MNFKTKLAILGLVSKIFAAKFSVISFDGDCQLSLAGKNIPMTADPACGNLYTVESQAQSGDKYKYVCGGKAEEFDRTLQGDKTHNELFERALTVSEMPEFGFPASDISQPWTRSIGRTELFDPTYVPTVIIDASKDYFVKGSGSTTANKMTFILKDSVHTFEGVRLEAKNDEQDKFQMKFDLPGNGLYNRTGFKFRPSSEDPVFIRQILYGDIAHAIGNPAHESVAARVYLSNGTKIALYVLQEDVTTASFINSHFYGNADGSIKQHPESPVFDCSTGADFTASQDFRYGFKPDTEDPRLYEIMAKIEETDPANEAAVKELNEKYFDLHTFLKAAALEYLAGHWDSYWFLATNFATHVADDNRLYFIDQDFDQTWSLGLKPSLGQLEVTPYTEYVNKDVSYWKETVNGDEGGKDAGTRVLINKFLGCDGQQTCITKELFENHLKSIVQHIFNPVAIGRKVNEGYKIRLDEEIKWDTTITRLHVNPTAQFHFTYDDFVGGIERGVSSTHGILDWTAAITDTVCKQFGIEYDKVALTPETASKVDAQVIDPGTKYDPKANLQSGASMTTAKVALTAIAAILGVVLYL